LPRTSLRNPTECARKLPRRKEVSTKWTVPPSRSAEVASFNHPEQLIDVLIFRIKRARLVERESCIQLLALVVKGKARDDIRARERRVDFRRFFRQVPGKRI